MSSGAKCKVPGVGAPRSAAASPLCILTPTMQAQGEWTEAEHALFLETARAHGVGDKWGLFASYLPQVRLQACSLGTCIAERLLSCMPPMPWGYNAAPRTTPPCVCLMPVLPTLRRYQRPPPCAPVPTAARGLPVQRLLPRRDHPSGPGHRPALQNDAQRQGRVRGLSARQLGRAEGTPAPHASSPSSSRTVPRAAEPWCIRGVQQNRVQRCMSQPCRRVSVRACLYATCGACKGPGSMPCMNCNTASLHQHYTWSESHMKHRAGMVQGR